MSGTVMKFGPQWIRTLTDGAASSTSSSSATAAAAAAASATTTTPTSVNTPTTSSPSSSSANNNNNNNPIHQHNNNNNSSSNNTFNAAAAAAAKYKLAEYRYGREEMLALFEQDLDAPEDIKRFVDLYVEKARMPMAMTQMSEEEVKLSTRNWNSEAVLRSSGKLAAANNAVAGGPTGGMLSNPNDRDTSGRQMSERGAPGTLTAAGVLSSSPRGPPGSLTRIPIEQRGLLSSLNSRGPPSTIRNLVGRGPNLYMRSQSHDDDAGGAAGGGSATNTSNQNDDATSNRFDRRYPQMPDLLRDPNSFNRLRFETSRSGGSLTSNTKPIDIKGGMSHSLDPDLSSDRGGTGRSVFDRIPHKYSVDDKIRKDINGKPIQSSDWRAREWTATGPSSKLPTSGADDRAGGSWRSSRGAAGAAEDWRSNSTSNTAANSSSWYVKSEDQRNVRLSAVATGGSMPQENLDLGFSGKRDTLRRPSVDDRHGDEEEDGVVHNHQPRHRRDSLPEWSIGDPLAGDKVGSFDASGAFREIARGEDGMLNDSSDKSHQNQHHPHRHQDAANYHQDIKSAAGEQEWRLKAGKESNNMPDSRTINSSNSLSEIEKLTLLRRATAANNSEDSDQSKQDSRLKQSADGHRNIREAQAGRDIHERFNDANFQNSIHNHSGEKLDLQTRTSPTTLADVEHKKSIDNSRNSASPQRPTINQQQQLPANLQQMLKKQQQVNQNQSQSYLAAIAGSSVQGVQQQQQQQPDDDGFAHLERAAEIMVAEWTAEEDQDMNNEAATAFFGNNKLNLTREQQDAQQAMLANNAEARLTNRIQQQQQQPQPGVEQSTGGNPSALVSDSNQKKFILLPFNHEDSQQWFYRDTQGVIQGPFSATEMFEWYKAGYFVKELLVRRACDELFYPLGDVIKLWDRIPFAPVPMNVTPPPPITTQTLLQMRAVNKQLELAAGLSAAARVPTQIPNTFGIAHPGPVLLHGPLLQQQQQQVQQALAAVSLNQNISGPQEQQAGIRQILEATRQHESVLQQQQQQQQRVAAQNLQNPTQLDQNEMQTQLRQLLAQLKNREGFSNLNAQEQQEVLVRQFVASRQAFPAPLQQIREQEIGIVPAQIMQPFFAGDPERFRNYQQRLELERRQKEEAEKQNRFIMEQRMKAEEEKQRIMSELKRQQKQKEENEKQQHRQEAEQDRIFKLSQLKQQQLAKQQEEFRQQMMNQQRLQQEKQQQKQQQQQQLATIQQQQQIERAKKAAQAQQVQQEQQRKTAWSTVSKPDQEPVSLATLQKMQEEEKEKEREKQRQIQQQLQSTQQQQQLQQQLQRQMTWANAAQQQKPAPIKTLAEIQKEEEERVAREKQKKTKVQPTVPNAGVWNNAASHLSWKNPPADS